VSGSGNSKKANQWKKDEQFDQKVHTTIPGVDSNAIHDYDACRMRCGRT